MFVLRYFALLCLTVLSVAVKFCIVGRGLVSHITWFAPFFGLVRCFFIFRCVSSSFHVTLLLPSRLIARRHVRSSLLGVTCSRCLSVCTTPVFGHSGLETGCRRVPRMYAARLSRSASGPRVVSFAYRRPNGAGDSTHVGAGNWPHTGAVGLASASVVNVNSVGNSNNNIQHVCRRRLPRLADRQ